LDKIVPGKTQCGKTGVAALRVYYYARENFEYKSRMLQLAILYKENTGQKTSEKI